ncbi:hypothetical protein CPB85DRAFT_256688 [Mucidula mucida]|nr:hypothetical protein CPB85DRAFT_256688 [Mucidula mucida]
MAVSRYRSALISEFEWERDVGAIGFIKPRRISARCSSAPSLKSSHTRLTGRVLDVFFRQSTIRDRRISPPIPNVDPVCVARILMMLGKRGRVQCGGKLHELGPGSGSGLRVGCLCTHISAADQGTFFVRGGTRRSRGWAFRAKNFANTGGGSLEGEEEVIMRGPGSKTFLM